MSSKRNIGFVDNQSFHCGAIWVGDYGKLTLADSVVYNNTAERGLFINQGQATLAGTSFSNNHALKVQICFPLMPRSGWVTTAN